IRAVHDRPWVKRQDNMIVSRRPETPEDNVFLHQLFGEHIRGELPLDHVSLQMKELILDMQVRLRLDAARNHSGAAGEVILADDQPAGWICTSTHDNELRLIEIVLRDEYRGKGIGTAVITDLIAAAGATRSVCLHVSVMNVRALQLYERLGFQRI